MQGKKNVELAKEINKINNVKLLEKKNKQKRKKKENWKSFGNVSVEKPRNRGTEEPF